MAQKIQPNSFRIGITKPWAARWFFKRALRYFLEEDEAIRNFLRKKVLAAGIDAIEIERTQGAVKVVVRAQKPGVIIGRGGKGIDDLKTGLLVIVRKLRLVNKINDRFNLNLAIEELRRSEVSASVVAQNIATDIEKRQPYRRIMRRQVEFTRQNREVKGIKIKLSGRLNGAEISRHETMTEGKMPLQTLRANIDYGVATSFNSYGTIGIKVWIYKGEVFEEKKPREERK
jgi:small subunit ribosomal protein S3